MENQRGICTNCGLVVTQPHECTADMARLVEIDREAGCRAVREALIALGQKGFNNKIETLEAEAAAIRTKK